MMDHSLKLISVSFRLTEHNNYDDGMPDKPPHIAAFRRPLMKLGTFSTTKDFGWDELIYWLMVSLRSPKGVKIKPGLEKFERRGLKYNILIANWLYPRV